MSSKGKTKVETGDGSVLVPKHRFPEFRDAGDWQEKSLSSFLTLVARERKKPSEDYKGLGLRSHGKGTFLKEQEDPAKNSMEVLYEVKREDLIINITFAWEGAIAIAGCSDDGALVSHRFPTYIFSKDRALPEFFKFKVVDKRFVYKLGLISPGGAGRNRVMSKTNFLKLKVFLPKVDEQKKIANCLDAVDALIAAQARKVEVLRYQKKGLMQQLFPRPERVEDGIKIPAETRPRLRLPEFEGTSDWEEKPFSAIIDLVSGLHLSPDEYSDSGEVPYFSGPSDFTDELSEARKWTASTKSAAKSGDTLITVKGSGVGEVWFSSLPAVALGRQLMAVRPKAGQIHRFVFQFLLTKKRRLEVLGEGNLIPGLSRPDILDLKAFFPKPPEQ
ncbi:restriction endonuclease subunit S, partial [Rhizobium leguminosarum]|nr:restriction endonuclease subunit S [Rhizobium leguminosarum]